MTSNLAGKIRGGLYGVAVGDALGATLEFMGKEEIRARYGELRDIVGGGWLNLRPGEWTDDTEMTLAVAEGVMKDPESPVPYIGEAFLRWRSTNPPDIGSTTRAVFHTYGRLKDWHRAAQRVHEQSGRTAGNGALMRTLPLAFVYPDAVDLYMRSMEVARMTHWDPEAGLTCFLYCLIAQRFINGAEDPLAAFEEARVGFFETVLPSMREPAEKIVARVENLSGKAEGELRPTGYTLDTLGCALWAVLTRISFEDAVVTAVNLGGDADTVGAVTGGLAGVMYGYEAIPQRWLERFNDKQRNRLDKAAAGLIQLARKQERR